MSNRITQIALKICLIKEEFTETDIIEAVKLLEERGSSSALLSHLAKRKVTNGKLKAGESGRKNKSIEEQRSKAVIDLEDEDPEKFHLLSEFDALIRKGELLPEVDDIRRLGEQLSKDFKPRSSRKEAISRLLALIAKLPIDEIREIVAKAQSFKNQHDRSSEYHELAQFLITGKTSHPKTA